VKLVKDERESAAMRAFVADGQLLSSELVLTEVLRAIHRSAPMDPTLDLATALKEAERLLARVALEPIHHGTLLAAGAWADPNLRSLDAIHVVTAVDLRPFEAFLTYDKRQAAAARLSGLRTVSPGA
jgi:uncharacterized protein